MPYFGPIIPHDSPLALPDKNRLRKRIAIFAALGIVCFGLVAVALQGCNRGNAGALAQAGVTNALPVFEAPVELPAAIEANPAPGTPATTARARPPRPLFAGTRSYKIAKGDNFDTLAKKFRIPRKTLEDANPGLEPKKLQIDQVIQIPIPPSSGSNGLSNSAVLTTR